jgi:hypothetical protein
MGWRKRVKVLLSPLMTNRWRTVALVGFAVWCVLLRYVDLGTLLVVFSMPFGIVLFCMGPLEFVPKSWSRFNFFVASMMSLFFQGSLMFLWIALSFELPWSKAARGVFIVLCIALQVIIISWIQRRTMRSYIRKRSEQCNRAQ